MGEIEPTILGKTRVRHDIEQPTLPAHADFRQAGNLAHCTLWTDQQQAATTFGHDHPSAGEETQRPGMLQTVRDLDQGKVSLL